MIKADIKGLEAFTDLRTKITNFRTQVQHLTRETQLEIQKESNSIFDQNITQLVYERYEPQAYERTYHLRGKHGAIDESLDENGYRFSIDENSRDPVDNETWEQKAERVETGQMYGPGFGRPFIDEIQDKLEKENERQANIFEKRINDLIDKI